MESDEEMKDENSASTKEDQYRHCYHVSFLTQCAQWLNDCSKHSPWL